MKIGKALKKLERVEELLADVIAKYNGAEGAVRDLLDIAKESVFRAKAKIERQYQASATAQPVSSGLKVPKKNTRAAEARRAIKKR